MTDIEQRYAQWKARKADADEAVERQYQAWLKKRKRTAFTDDDPVSRPISIFRKDQDTAQNWYQKSADTVNEIYQYYSDWKPRDEQKYQYFQNTTNSLLSEADKWRAQFAGNDEALRAIDDVASALATTNENLPKSYDYWAQWDTEDNYNKAMDQYLADKKDEEEKLSFDTVAGQKKIDNLQAELIAFMNDYVRNPNFNYDDHNTAAAFGDEKSKKEQIIAEKKKYLEEAKALQEKNAQLLKWRQEYYDTWGHYADAEDFEQYYSVGKTLHYTDFGSTEAHGSKGARKKRYTTIDNYRAAAIALYEHNGGKAAPEDTEKYSDQINIYRTMKDDEFRLLSYFIAKDKEEGTNLAEKYVDAIGHMLRSRRGYEIATDLDNIGIPVVEDLAKLATGFENGYINAYAGISQYVTGEKLPPDISQYTNAYISDSLDGLAGYAYEAATNIGNMMPSLLISAALGREAGAVMTGLSAGGNAYARALNWGYNKTQAKVYGTIIGALEGGLQYAIGGISKLSGVQGGKILSKIAAINNAALRISAKLGWSEFKEIGEEELQNYLEPAVRAIILGEEYDAPAIEELLDTAVVTALSTGVLEGGTTIYEDIQGMHYIDKKAAPYGSTQQKITSEMLEIILDNAFSEENAAAIAEALLARASNQQLTVEQQDLLDSVSGNDVVQNAVTNIVNNRQSTMGQRDQNIRNFVENIASNAEKSATGEGGTVKYSLKTFTQDGKRFVEIDQDQARFDGRAVDEYPSIAKSIIKEKFGKDVTKIEDVTQDIMNSYGQSPKFQFLRTSSIDSIRNSRGNVKARGNGGVKYAFKGYAEDGKGIYESNFPKGTPKKAKGEKILEYIQNVWSKKPITLRVEDGNHTRLIKAQFDPTYDAEHGQRSDASKLMGGNRHGTSSEQRVTLDLADDYYQLAEDARYNYSKEETGKETATHKDVKRWHYFINDIYFAEYSSDTLVPYTVSINIKENPDGNYFYSFSAERAEKNGESPTQRTLHAVVNSSENTTANGKLSTDSIRNSRGNVKARGKGGVYYGYHGQRLNKLHLTAAQRVAVDFSERLAKKWGMTFYFYESQTDIFGRRIYRDKNGNWVQAEDGFYDPSDGSIHVDLNAGAYGQGAILFTVAHELTHHIQQWSPDAYHKLCDILTQGYLGAGQPLGIHVQLRQQLAQEAGRELTYKEAYDEVMAHSLESVLADGKVMQLLEQIEAEDKSLAARVRRFFRDVVQLIWETVDTYWGLQPDSPEGRMVQQMKKLGAELEDAFAYGLYQAGQNFSQAGKSAAGNSSAGIQYAVREAFSSELQTWFDSTTHEERKVSGKRFLIGTTTDVLKSIGVKDYKIYFGGAKIDKILTGNSSMTLDTIKDAVMLLEDPILIMKSLTVENSIVLFGEVYTSGNKPVMISVLLDPTTKSGSVLDYAVITSAYGRRKSNLQHLVNNSEIYYVNEQKNRTDKWLKALGLQLPSALTKYGSINSIHNADKDVKMRDSLKVVSKKSEEGDPAKKFPATRPFAVEQDSLDENIPYSEQTVKANDSAQYRYSARQDLRQKNALAAAIRADVVHAHEALLQEMTSRGVDQRNAKIAVSALIDAAYTRATQRQVDFLRYMRTESPYAAQYNAALEAVFPGSTGTVTTAPAVGTDAYSGPTLGVSSVEDNAHTGPQAINAITYDTNTSGENTVLQEMPLDGEALQPPLLYDIKDNRKKEFQQAFADGKIKTLISQQKQARHVQGTKEFAVYAEKMAVNGDAPSYIREDLTNLDLERIVVSKLKGNVLVTGKDTYREFVDCDEVIGYYYSKKAGGYVETRCAQVTYAPKRGNIHIIPVREDEGSE